MSSLASLQNVTPEKSEQALVNRIVLQKMLQQALQVNNPSKAWFADIIRKQLAILALIAQKQQEQGIDIPPEVRAILDPKALMRSGGKCLKISKGGKGTKVPRGLVDPSCVKDDQWVYNRYNNKIYMIDKTGGRKKWMIVEGLPLAIRKEFKRQHLVVRGGRFNEGYGPNDEDEKRWNEDRVLFNRVGVDPKDEKRFAAALEQQEQAQQSEAVSDGGDDDAAGF